MAWASSPTARSPRAERKTTSCSTASARRTARAPPRYRCAGWCSRTLRSFHAPAGSSAWRRTARSSTSSCPRPRWPKSDGSGAATAAWSIMPIPVRRSGTEWKTERKAVMTQALFDALRHITTGTITTVLLKKGIRRCWMSGPKPLHGAKRIVGPAFTLRFVPVREDLATPESWAKPISTRGAIEEMPEGCVAVADAMGITTAGIFGDILTMRMVRRGVTALVTDGVVRDKVGVLASGLPVWCAGVAAPASVNGLTFIAWQEPIGCGGCAIFPDDVIVADEDGVVVIPQNLLEFVAAEGAEHERMEGFIVSEVEKGAKLPGLYPMNEETRARYAAWKKQS